MSGMSMNIEQTNLDKLRSVFPECVSEGKLDIDKLLSLCGEYIDNDFEKYKFEWKGKADCLRLAQKRSTGTLRPCPEESVDWDTTQNLYIEGDNLEVLKLLQTAYYRKVKMIYIDPPYNTGNDFVYADDFADPMARYKEVTQQTTKSNPETMGRYHTNWLNMMYPRLRLAANLLRDDGCLKAVFHAYGMPYPNYAFYCTCRASRTILGNKLPNHQLQTVAQYCGYDLENHHHALADAEACAQIAIKILNFNL